MDKTVIRQLVATNTLIMGLMTSYIVLKEGEEEEEVQQRKRPQYWVNRRMWKLLPTQLLQSFRRSVVATTTTQNILGIT